VITARLRSTARQDLACLRRIVAGRRRLRRLIVSWFELRIDPREAAWRGKARGASVLILQNEGASETLSIASRPVAKADGATVALNGSAAGPCQPSCCV